MSLPGSSIAIARASRPIGSSPLPAPASNYASSIRQSRADRPLEAFRNSIRVAPDWAYPRHNLALTYIEMGNNSAAEAEYRAAIKKTPEHPYLYYNLGVLLQR